jgi:hypothetical protein
MGTDEFLISDADRDQISAVLSQHMAEGRLTVDELDQRVGRLYESRTREQAAAVVADLPALERHALPEEPGHFHLGHEHTDPVPALPSWLTDGGLDSGRRLSSAGAPGPPPAAAPQSKSQANATYRKRAKQQGDVNAIGHTFQAARRAITSDLEAATAAGSRDEAHRANERLREAKEAAESARGALAAGDRAELQRQLQRLRDLGATPPGRDR